MPKKLYMETGISALERTLEELWGRIRQSNLYGGRPRNALSEESVAAARSALSVAEESGDPRFLREAWHMMAYALTANEGGFLTSAPFVLITNGSASIRNPDTPS